MRKMINRIIVFVMALGMIAVFGYGLYLFAIRGLIPYTSSLRQKVASIPIPSS